MTANGKVTTNIQNAIHTTSTEHSYASHRTCVINLCILPDSTAYITG